MEGEVNQFTIIHADNMVIGFSDKRSLQEYLNEFKIEKILQYCETEGLDFDGMSQKKLKAIASEINDINNEDKIYRTKNLVSAVEGSTLDEEIKSELTELLLEYNTEFYIDEYDGLYEVLNAIEDIDI
jgi:uncharacterized protein YbaP (TraB family)